MSIPKPGFYPALGVAVGSSVRRRDEQPSIERAIGNAHERVMKKLQEGPLHYRVSDVFAIGTNPISEYRVVLQVDLN